MNSSGCMGTVVNLCSNFIYDRINILELIPCNFTHTICCRFISKNNDLMVFEQQSGQISTWSIIIQKMEKSLILVLLVAITWQKQLKIKQSKYIFDADIPGQYSITSEIYNDIKQQQIAKNRPVTPFQQHIGKRNPQSPRRQPHNKIMGFVNEASANNRPPINLQNQIANIAINGNKAIPMKTSSNQLSPDHTVIFEEEQVVPLKQPKDYVLYHIDQKSVFDEEGMLIKSDRIGPTETPVSSQLKSVQSKQNSLISKTNQEDIKKKLDTINQYARNKFSTPISQPIDNQVSSNSDENKISKVIAGPGSKGIKIDNKKFYPFQTEAEQIRREQEQEIIKILFSSLFFIAILLVVFGYRPQGKKQEGIVNKDEELSRLK